MGYSRLTILGVAMLLMFSAMGTAVTTQNGLYDTKSENDLQNIETTDLDNIQPDQTSAHLGENTGTLDTEDSQVQFIFDSNVSRYYHLALYGPSDTDFDLSVENSDGDIVTQAYGTTYPDETEFVGDGNQFTITVFSYIGFGDFTLNITKGYFAAYLGQNNGTLTSSEVNYTLSTNFDQYYNLSLFGDAGTDFDIYVYDSGEYLLTSSLSTSYPETTSFEGNGDFVTITIEASSGTGDYSLRVYQSVINVSLNNYHQGVLINETSEVDFNFDTALNDRYNVSIWADPSIDLDLLVYNNSGHVIASALGTSYPDFTTFVGNGNQFTITVYSFSGVGQFELQIRIVPEITEAIIGENPGTLNSEDSQVDFLLDATGNYNYTLSLEADSSTDFDMAVYDPTNYVVASATGISYPDVTSFIPPQNGTYIISVYSYSGSGDFVLTITEEEAPDGVNGPVGAVLGENTGSLTGSTDEDLWEFSTVSGQWYEFSLAGPDGTDFDMVITDETGQELAYAIDTTYPDTIELEGDGSAFIIEVYSYSGSGSYVLTISEIEAPLEFQSATYSSAIRSGDSFMWNVSYTEDDQPVTDGDIISDGDQFTVEFNTDGSSITVDNTNPDLSGDVTISHNGQIIDESDSLYSGIVHILVLPTTFTLTDGTTLGLLDALNEGIWFGFVNSWSQQGNEIVGSSSDYGLNTEIRIDAETGLVTLFGQSDSMIDLSITLSTDISDDGEGGPSDILDIPVSSIAILFSIFTLPVLRRKIWQR